MEDQGLCDLPIVLGSGGIQPALQHTYHTSRDLHSDYISTLQMQAHYFLRGCSLRVPASLSALCDTVCLCATLCFLYFPHGASVRAKLG